MSKTATTKKSLSLLEDSSYQDIHCAGHGQDENSVKQCDQVLVVGEGGGEEAVEGDAAEVGDCNGEEAENHNLHPSPFF